MPEYVNSRVLKPKVKQRGCVTIREKTCRNKCHNPTSVSLLLA
jgi:hypothetical protein